MFTMVLNKNTFFTLFILISLPILPKQLISTEIYSTVWQKVLEIFRNEPFYLFTLGTMASLGVPFWLTIMFFMPLDLWGRPNFLLAYKVQEEKNVPVTWKTYKKALNVVNKNQLISTIMILAIYPLTQWGGMTFKLDDLPSPSLFILHLIYLAISEEIGFYYLHRLMHHHLLYKRIHKTHHEWTAPISLAVVYVHPIEHVVVNMVPILLSPIVIGTHLSTAWAWFVIATFVSTIHHSGYHFPGFPSPEFHDFHHLKFNQCFGVIGFLDWIHRTDEGYRKSENYKHDKILFGFKPISKNSKA